jgi:hypothetical protein
MEVLQTNLEIYLRCFQKGDIEAIKSVFDLSGVYENIWEQPHRISSGRSSLWWNKVLK